MPQHDRPPSTSRTRGTRRRPHLAAAVATALAVVPQVASAGAGACTAQDLVNPMAAAWPVGSDHPFAIRTTGDLELRNQELEGSAAVGGTLRVTSQNDYPILHSLGGYGDYAPPRSRSRTR